MIGDASARAVGAARWRGPFIRPLYDSYCFTQIPRLVGSLLVPGADAAVQTLLLGRLAGAYETVILVWIDAFGWRFLEQYGEQYPFLRRLVREGVVTKLTSQFPSTTAAHSATIHTGLEVGQSGVYEWFYYEPLLDAMIAPLLFSFAGDRARNTLERTGVAPEQLYPRTTLYQALGRHGVRSFAFGSRDYTPSPFSRVVCDGAELVPFVTFHDALNRLAELALRERGPTYLFLYSGSVDLAGHRHGVNSAEFRGEIDTCFRLLESVLHTRLAGRLENALLLVTADHGQVEAHPAKTIYLNRLIPGIERWMETTGQGRPRVPAGSCRDMFLHIREERLEEARVRLQERLAGRAEVQLVRDLIAEGFFGSAPPSRAFLSRVGNLVILPYEHQSVWWHEEGRFAQAFYGHHGGLTPAEMETFLAALPLSK